MIARTACLLGVYCLVGLVSAKISMADDDDAVSGKKTAMEHLGRMQEPLATGLDVHTLNPKRGETGGGQNGEMLSLFDEFLAIQGISQEWTADDLDALHTLVKRDYELAKAEEKSLDDRYDVLKERLKKLEDDIEDEKAGADLPAYLQMKAKAAPLKSQRNVLRKYLDTEKPLLKKLAAAQANPDNARLRLESCNTAVRVLYSLFSGQMMDERNGEPLPVKMRHNFQIARHFVGRALLNTVPFFSEHRRHQRIGPSQAKNQATNLVDPANPNRFLTTAEIAEMSHAAVAELDVSPMNPMWHTRKKMETQRPDTWRLIENWVEDEVTKELLDKKKFKKKFPDFSYDLDAARRVLFWDNIKNTATSPKVDTVDVFGQKWKLKWGEETVIEPVGNRLRMLLGAKYCDLTYANVGGDSHLLILPSKLERKMEPNKEMPLTEAELITVLAESTYEFNIKPFILSSGVITKENADAILKNLPKETPKKYKAKKLIGRVWIRFRESMVESKHKVINRGGPISTNTDFSKTDRAMRQAMMMTLWMEDTDVKEDNHRSAWAKDFAGCDGSQYFEFFHDPGSSFGGASRSGELNKFSAKRGTGGFMWISPNGRNVISNAFQIYRPLVWSNNAFTDHFAGAKHIVRLTCADIRKVVRSSQMPDFYQECMTWRLAKRRDIIAHTFSIPLPDLGAGDAPNITIPLTSRSDRHAAASRYRIPLSEIENDLVRTGFLPAENRAADTAKPFNDVLVKDGFIQRDHATILLGILRDLRYPSGFTRRISRFTDDKEWKSHRYLMK